MKPFARQFYLSIAWQRCRASYIKSVYGLCERCLKNGHHIPGKILHHQIVLNSTNINDINVTLNWDNLEYLCQDCHNKEHHGESVVADGLLFRDGELIKEELNNQ